MANALTRVALWLLVAAFPMGAVAQQSPEPVIGTGLLCDTAAQVEEVVALSTQTRNFAASVAAVNAKASGETNACAVASVAYIRGETVKTAIRTPDGPRDIVKITVVGAVLGVEQGVGIVRPVPPQDQYTLFTSKGESI